jgi:dihydroorotase (multifunctional complex type)
MTKRLMIRNALYWTGEDLVPANILIEDGKIAGVSKKTYKDVDEVLEAYNQPVIPGGIDIHAHIYDPEYLDNEDWKTGSLAAAYGGITSVYDMPLRVFVDNKSVLEDKIKAAQRDSYINYGIHAGFMNEKNYEKIPELAEEGVKGYKVFTCRPFKANDEGLVKVFEMVRDVNGVVLAHSEDDALIGYGENLYNEFDDIVSYHKSRSPEAEAAAILKIGFYARQIGNQLHICHLSSMAGVESIRFLRRMGVNITVETCPHYLYFTRDDAKKYGTLLKLAPTLKTQVDRDALWRALEDGTINAYTSDNAPAPRSLKEKNVWEAWGGIPNLEIMGPFLYTYGVKQERLSFKRFVEVFSTGPAKIMDIYPEKGALMIGSDADIIVLDTRKPRKISPHTHHHKVDWTPWEGMELYGSPLHLLVNGEIIIRDEELVGSPGHGKYLRKKTPRQHSFL